MCGKAVDIPNVPFPPQPRALMLARCAYSQPITSPAKTAMATHTVAAYEWLAMEAAESSSELWKVGVVILYDNETFLSEVNAQSETP